jgi:hypothetical protein
MKLFVPHLLYHDDAALNQFAVAKKYGFTYAFIYSAVYFDNNRHSNTFNGVNVNKKNISHNAISARSMFARVRICRLSSTRSVIMLPHKPATCSLLMRGRYTTHRRLVVLEIQLWQQCDRIE